MLRLLLGGLCLLASPAFAQVQAAKKADPGALGGKWYGSVEVRHHANVYYDESGYYERLDPAVHARLQLGAQFYEGMVDAYTTLGVFKETESQQVLQRQPEVALDLYPVKNDYFQLLQYNFVQLPVRRSNTSDKPTEEDSSEAYNPATVYTVGLAPTVKFPVVSSGTRIEFKAGVDGWTRLYSRKQYVEGEQILDDEDEPSRFGLNAPAGEDQEPIEDRAMHYQGQGLAGIGLSPAFARSFNAETTGHYHSRWTPRYSYNDRGGTDYEYGVDRYSYYRVRLKLDLNERLALTNDFYHFHQGLFEAERKGEERRYRNILRLSCRL